jgi:hypothetical protein
MSRGKPTSVDVPDEFEFRIAVSIRCVPSIIGCQRVPASLVNVHALCNAGAY